MEFKAFSKIPRLKRPMTVTEKLDGTNAQIYISFTDHERPVHIHLTEVGPLSISAGSRNRWITPDDDNFGFARWVREHAEELIQLGEGQHFGEWWGSGIQRGYGLTNGERRFSLFNVGRWNADNVPSCCSVVPVIYKGEFDTEVISQCVNELRANGSSAQKGFMKPEGVIVHHAAANSLFKVTLEDDDVPKSQQGIILAHVPKVQTSLTVTGEA